MTPHEETIVLEARDILGRYLSQNPVIGSWQALIDYLTMMVWGAIEGIARDGGSAERFAARAHGLPELGVEAAE